MRFLACSRGARVGGLLEDFRSEADRVAVAKKITQMRLREHTMVGSVERNRTNKRRETSRDEIRAMAHVLR
jgi:hypothetical protein